MRRTVLAVLLVVAGVGTAGAQQPPAGEFSLRPVRSPSAPPRERSYVVRTVRPGAEFTDRLEAVNLTDGALDLDIAAVDARVGVDGSFAPGAERQAEGAWIDVSPARVRVQARSTAPVQVRVRIPTDAAPGDHIAAVVAQKADPPSGSGVQLRQRVGVRVYLTVERPEGGVGERSFDFRALRWVGAPRARVFEAEVVNTGALLVEPLGRLSLGRGDLRTEVDVPVLGTVPGGESRTLRFTVPGELDPGTYDASLRLRDVNGGPEQERRTTFTVGTPRSLKPVDDDGLPLVPGVLAAGVLLGVAALLVRRWRSGGESGGE